MGAISCNKKASHWNCTATYDPSALLPGTYTISAAMTSDSNYAASSGSGTLTVVGGGIGGGGLGGGLGAVPKRGGTGANAGGTVVRGTIGAAGIGTAGVFLPAVAADGVTADAAPAAGSESAAADSTQKCTPETKDGNGGCSAEKSAGAR